MSELQAVFVFALFPGVTQLDFTGPHEAFSSLPGASLILASTEGGTIEATGGVCFSRLRRLSEVPSCDVVCVPGGVGATDSAVRDDVFLAELPRLAATARSRRRPPGWSPGSDDDAATRFAAWSDQH